MGKPNRSKGNGNEKRGKHMPKGENSTKSIRRNKIALGDDAGDHLAADVSELHLSNNTEESDEGKIVKNQ